MRNRWFYRLFELGFKNLETTRSFKFDRTCNFYRLFLYLNDYLRPKFEEGLKDKSKRQYYGGDKNFFVH